MFKRIFWSGSKAKFIGTTWHSADRQVSGIEVTVNYHKNVDHAFQTAKGTEQVLGLAAYVNSLGGQMTIAAHSLGNIVVSSSISDWEMNVSNYFMIDAAVASEAFDTTTITSSQNNNMIHPDWMDYPGRVRASEWYKLFPSEDPRSRLTWRGRLGNSGAFVFNFYSSGEEVLAEHPNSLGNPSILDAIYTGVARLSYCGERLWRMGIH
jgi:hypothetical protein